MKYLTLLLFIILIIFCIHEDVKSTNDRPVKELKDTIQPIDSIIVCDSIIPEKIFLRFDGRRYSVTFDDVHDLHIGAAEKKGIGPMSTRDDTTAFTGELIRIPLELNVYKVKKLTHSVPYLVPDAVTLLSDICINFRDSLISKKMPLYKPVVTSITRTDADVKKLTRRNRNAVPTSAHCYGTTFDISWVSFEQVDPKNPRTANQGRLKQVLGEVLSDLRLDRRCYVKYERRQPCFHITVR